ncbi:MAG: hypothetical protein FJ303_06770 [Planctomycetes bacterium]|nr:hypothetical protein [Planctomycetota bacterium]
MPHDWRTSGAEGAESGPTKPWHSGNPPAPTEPPASWLTVKRVAAAVLLVLLSVGVAVVYQWLSPLRPSCLVLIGSGYEANLLFPQNVHGQNGLIVLEKEVTADSGFFADILQFPWDQPTKLRRVGGIARPIDNHWQAMWDKLGLSSFREETVVVFVSLHGFADASDAYLIPDVSAKEHLKAPEKSRISFRDVLAGLANLGKKRVVLLLDVSAADTNWSTGVLHNDFVQRLQEKYTDQINANKNLVVICNASPDQRSWTSDELQRSAFAYFVAEALKGDGHEANSKVTALSLFKYVEKKVDTWAQANRARKQTPLLLGGEDRANAIRIVHIAKAYNSEPEKIAAPKLDVAGLDEAWNAWRRLRDTTAPHVVAPHLWRAYQDTLLRYESLLRCGDPTDKAPELKARLRELEADLAAPHALEAGAFSLGNSLAMRHVWGYAPSGQKFQDDALRSLMIKLRSTDPKVRDAARASYANFDDKAHHVFLRTRLSQVLLQELRATAPLERALEFQRLADLENTFPVKVPAVRPAEAHLLKMLLYAADSGLSDGLIHLAVRVRTLADEVAVSAPEKMSRVSYAEAIWPAIRSDLLQADTIRREGEDLLFGNPSAAAQPAQAKLLEAQSAYEAIRKRARLLQRAYALRDELSSELPYFARWLAAANPVQDQSNDDLEKLRTLITGRLGPGLVKLKDVLDKNDDSDIAARFVERMSGDFQTLRDAFRATCVRLQPMAGLQQNWHAIDAVLLAPFHELDESRPDAVVRSKLLQNHREIARKMFDNPKPEGQTEAAPPLEEHVSRQRGLLRASLLALRKFDPESKTRTETDVNDLFINMPSDVVKKTQIESLKQLASMEDAAERCRHVPSAYADELRDQARKAVNPVDRLRRLQLSRLCFGLAQRSVDDHWFEPAENKQERYYERAAMAYVESGKSLHEDEASQRLIDPEAARVVSAAKTKAEFALDPISDVYWTSRAKLEVVGNLRRGELLPHGTGAFWVERRAGAGSRATLTRRSIAFGPKPIESKEMEFALSRLEFEGVADATVHLHAFYRGQHVTRSAKSVTRPPDVIVRHFAPPEKAELAVRMDPAITFGGAISVVLDNSGSMAFVHPPKENEREDRPADPDKQERRRFDYALKAMRQVLDKVPENTSVSIFTLGKEAKKPPSNESRQAVTRYREPRDWRKSELDPLEKDLNARFYPEYGIGSPIAEAVVQAMDRGFPPGFKGPKMIIVLTDGDDNASFNAPSLKTEAQYAQHKTTVVNKLIDANKTHNDISMVIVCFIDRDSERSKAEFARAKAQFSCVEEFTPRGQFLDEKEGEKLGDRIEWGIRPRLQLESLAKGPTFSAQSVNFFNDGSLGWPLKVPPGDYKAGIVNSWPNDKVDVGLFPPQRLLMVFRRDANELILRRGILAEQPEAANLKPRQQKDWIATLLENDHRSGELRQIVTIEQKNTDGKMRVRHRYPGFVWLDLETFREDKKVPWPSETLQWATAWDVPAPAFRLRMAQWPQSTYAKLNTWYWPTERNLMLAQPFVTPWKLPENRKQVIEIPLRSSEAKVRVDLAVDEREFLVTSGKKMSKKCLIVRVQHPEGTPIWVDLKSRYPMPNPDFPFVGSEHHYFVKDNSCTAYFYDLDLTSREIEFLFFDINAFKRAAGEYKVEFTPSTTWPASQLFVPESVVTGP